MAESSLKRPWGDKDVATDCPIFSPMYVKQEVTQENASGLYETPEGKYNKFVAFTTPEEISAEGCGVCSTGWVMCQEGTGNKDGKTSSEVLVAMTGLKKSS